MTIHEDVMAALGMGQDVEIHGYKYTAFPMTCAEHLEYIRMSSDAPFEPQPDGTVVRRYRDKVDEATDTMAMMYVLWTALHKQDGAHLPAFSDWVDKTPASVLVAFSDLIGAVLRATVEPYQKKN